MSITKVLCIFIAIVTISALPVNTLAEVPLQALPSSNETVPFSFTVKGGISLGSYEAGVNWAIIEYMRRMQKTPPPANYLNPKLISLSGASAGSINAVLTALTWCKDVKKKYSVDNNPIKGAWVNVGVDHLLPEKANKYTDPPKSPVDGMFARSAFEDSIALIKEELSNNGFAPDSEIPIGMATTRTTRADIDFGPGTAGTQRFMFIVNFVVDDKGRGHFESKPVPENDPDLGNVAYLPGQPDNKGNIRVDVEQVIKLMKASSAFPVAFGSIPLDYCTSPKDPEAKASPHCPKGTGLIRNKSFSDGGVFDNMPLGTAKVLAETAIGKNDRRRNWYFYISPEKRRLPYQLEAQQIKKARPYGLNFLLSYVSELMGSVNDYEIFKVLNSGEWTRQSHTLAKQLLSDQVDVKASIEKQNDDSNKTKEQAENYAVNDTVSKDLNTDFSELTKSARNSCSTVEASNKLIGSAIKELENNYLPFQLKDGAKRPDESTLVKIRYSLLACLNETAKLIGRDDLTLSIKKSMLDRFGERELVSTSRYFPLTGTYLGHFGAFLDKPFREFDYYSGVYDAVHDLAAFVCKGIDEFKEPACRGNVAKTIYKELELGDDPLARTVFSLIASEEHTNISDDADPWHWVNDEKVKSDSDKVADEVHNMKAIFDSLKTSDDGDDETKFENFIGNLAKNGYKPETRNKHSLTKRILDHPDWGTTSWYAPLADKVTKRLQKLETYKCEPNEACKTKKWLAFLVSLIGGKAFTYNDFFTFSPSSEPKNQWGYKFIPYEINTDIANGGFSIAYLFQLKPCKAFSVDLKLTPIGDNKFGNDRIWFSQADLYASGHYNSILSFGVGPTYNYLWEPTEGFDRGNLGFAGYIEIYRTLRITSGVRSLGFDSNFNGNNYYTLIGLPDLPGLFSRIFNSCGETRNPSY